MEWDTAILTGFCTGMGVIFAQKFVNWLDRHPITIKLKRTVTEITKNNIVKNDEKETFYLEDLMRK